MNRILHKEECRNIGLLRAMRREYRQRIHSAFTVCLDSCATYYADQHKCCQGQDEGNNAVAKSVINPD